ncbi:hypothetical protein BYT27DRAFT_7259398 [Phlegmacium glaucopus]|nr:hypothetical protein BYT27DRAFT_7259398 [Phlegmacium glaucopus]
MLPPGAPRKTALKTVYNTVVGRALVCDILLKRQPRAVEPHNYQLEGICHALDGVDVVATMATGAGKTGFYCFIMIVILAISRDPELALDGMTFPQNPCMLLISPTKALQQDMNRNMTAFGLNVVVINSNTCAEAHGANKDLWIETCTKDFCKRICKLGIDEIHLLHWWGRSFRPAFQQVGFLRPRLPLFRGSNISLIGTTATLQKGRILNNICNLLGLKPGSYHCIQRSNMRHDIQLIFREMRSGIGGTSFPELDWVVDEG